MSQPRLIMPFVARPSRNDDQLGWFHVMNRGAGRRVVFHSNSDRRLFLRLAADASDRFGVELHAFCLMGNHFHLLVKCPAGGLSSFMQLIGANYTRAVNERTASDGPIFRSRFHSLVVSSGEYLDRVGRYIHRNPLDLAERLSLADYLWCSYRYYVAPVPVPGWLHTEVLLDMHDGRSGYRDFVEGDLQSSGDPAVVDWAIRTAIAETTNDLEHGAPGLERTVAAALLNGHQSMLAHAAGELVAHQNLAARQQAIRRAVRRTTTDSSFAALVTRATHLAT